MEQRRAFPNHSHPLPNVQGGEQDSGHSRNHGPAESSGFVALLRRPYRNEHGQAAGKQNQRHHGNIDDAMKRSWPIGGAVAYKSVGDETAGKGGRVCDDEQPHRHLFCGNRECGRGHYLRRAGSRHLPVN